MDYGKLYLNLSNSVISDVEIKNLINNGKLNNYAYNNLSEKEMLQVKKTINDVFDRIIKPKLKEESKQADFNLEYLEMHFENMKENCRSTLKSSVSNEDGLVYAITLLDIGICNYVLNNAEEIVKEDVAKPEVKEEKAEKKENPIKKFFKNLFKVDDEKNL